MSFKNFYVEKWIDVKRVRTAIKKNATTLKTFLLLRLLLLRHKNRTFQHRNVTKLND